MIIELAAIAAEARLYDVDIFAADRVLNFAAALSRRELCKDAIARREAECSANTIDEGRVGVATKNDDVSDHYNGSRSIGSIKKTMGGKSEILRSTGVG